MLDWPVIADRLALNLIVELFSLHEVNFHRSQKSTHLSLVDRHRASAPQSSSLLRLAINNSLCSLCHSHFSLDSETTELKEFDDVAQGGDRTTQSLHPDPVMVVGEVVGDYLEVELWLLVLLDSQRVVVLDSLDVLEASTVQFI